jgi:hypothetical protein
MKKSKLEARLRLLERTVQNHLLNTHSTHLHMKLGPPRPAFDAPKRNYETEEMLKATPWAETLKVTTTGHPCRHTACGRMIEVRSDQSFLDTLDDAGWVARRYVATSGRNPDCWCPEHAHERPVPKPDLEVVVDDPFPPTVIRDMLLLVKDSMPRLLPFLAEIEGWLPHEREEVGMWASAVHLRASDNPVEIPELPEVLGG